MPHIIVEATPNVLGSPEVHQLCRKLHDGISEQEGVNPEAVKTRFYFAEHSIIGSGARKGGIHIDLKLLPGRSEETLRGYSEFLFDILMDSFPNNDDEHSLTVEVSELSYYTKN